MSCPQLTEMKVMKEEKILSHLPLLPQEIFY